MNRTITFNELRKIKDSLPTGSMHRIADELNLSVETVRNFFGGHNFKDGKSVGILLRYRGILLVLPDSVAAVRCLCSDLSPESPRKCQRGEGEDQESQQGGYPPYEVGW